MVAAAPRFLSLLRHRHHRHNLLLLSSYFHRLSFSSSSSPLPPLLSSPLKLKPFQHQQLKRFQNVAADSSSSSPSFSSDTAFSSSVNHPWPEWSRFMSHIFSAGYIHPALPPPAEFGAFALPPELPQQFVNDAAACLAFARHRRNLLMLLSRRDNIAVVVEHGVPFLFQDADDSVSKMKAFVSNNGATVLDSNGATMVDLMKFMLSYASSPLISSESNNLYNRELVESSVRNLFGELFKLSYNAPRPNSSDSVQNEVSSGFGQTILGYLRRNTHHLPPLSPSYRTFCSRGSNLLDESQAPTAIDYRSILQEGEFHRLAESTIHTIQEKLEDYGDNVEVDGFDIDYGNDVLTVKLGDLGTYVLNKQTPNRQLWLSSPLSGPSRFDWDQDNKAWIYRRTKANLYEILEFELEQLCGKPIVLS